MNSYSVEMVDVSSLSSDEIVPVGTLLADFSSGSFNFVKTECNLSTFENSIDSPSWNQIEWIDSTSDGMNWLNIESKIKMNDNKAAFVECNVIGMNEKGKINIYKIIYSAVRNDKTITLPRFSLMQAEEKNAGNVVPIYNESFGLRIRGGSSDKWFWRIEMKVILFNVSEQLPSIAMI